MSTATPCQSQRVTLYLQALSLSLMVQIRCVLPFSLLLHQRRILTGTRRSLQVQTALSSAPGVWYGNFLVLLMLLPYSTTLPWTLSHLSSTVFSMPWESVAPLSLTRASSTLQFLQSWSLLMRQVLISMRFLQSPEMQHFVTRLLMTL